MTVFCNYYIINVNLRYNYNTIQSAESRILHILMILLEVMLVGNEIYSLIYLSYVWLVIIEYN